MLWVRKNIRNGTILRRTLGGRHVQSFFNSFEFYNVLWIEWHGGIAYRKALDRVVKPVWDSRILEEIGL